MTIILYYFILFQVDSFFPPDATDSDSTKTRSDGIALPGLFEGLSPAPGPSESVFESPMGMIPTSENKGQDLFGLKCPERNIFMAPSNGPIQTLFLRNLKSLN